MYITTTKSKSSNGKEHHSILLRESYRQGKQVKNRTIANFTKLPAKDIDAMKLALKHREDLSVLGSLSETVTLEQGPSVGAVWTVVRGAQNNAGVEILGIQETSGFTFEVEHCLSLKILAERGRFELPIRLPAYSRSRRAHSTTLAPLQRHSNNPYCTRRIEMLLPIREVPLSAHLPADA
jgi:hypothetical protein